MSATKGKQATKGQKQIYEDNQQTLNFYLYMAGGTAALFVVSVSVQLATYQFMRYMAKSVRSVDGKQTILDAGIDLNMEGGLGEYCKDIVILSSAVQILSICSVYFWWLYAVGPVYALYLLWTTVIAPWIFAPAPEEDASDEKRRKKREKRTIIRGR